jgi:hypothetical protein
MKLFFGLLLNLHDDALLASGFELRVFKPNAPVPVVEAEGCGDGIAQRFAGVNKTVVIQFLSSESNEANDNLHASLALLPDLDALLQWA